MQYVTCVTIMCVIWELCSIYCTERKMG